MLLCKTDGILLGKTDGIKDGTAEGIALREDDGMLLRTVEGIALGEAPHEVDWEGFEPVKMVFGLVITIPDSQQTYDKKKFCAKVYWPDNKY